MELSIIFFILAGVLLAILIGYSIWSARKEKSRLFSDNFASRPQQPMSNRMNEASLAQVKKENQPTPQQQLPLEESADEQININLNQNTPQRDPNEPVEPQMLTLYLVSPEGQSFQGEKLVQQLEEVGMQYGEHQIFHRHIDNAASPVIFSAANMMQPGVFDLNNLQSFSSVGLVFFMHVPSAGNDMANLRLLISTVDSLAQSLGGFVLNENRQAFDENSRLDYLQRIQ